MFSVINMFPKFLSGLFGLVLEIWSRWWDLLNKHTTVLAAAIFAVSWYAWWIKKSTRRIQPLPPGPRGLPFVGNLPFIEPDLHSYFAKLSQIYGPIFKLQLGRKVFIVISSAPLAKQVLKGHDAIFSNRGDPPAAAFQATYGAIDIAFSPNCPEWRTLRKVFIREMMSNSGLDACYAIRQEEVKEMLKEVYGKIGSPVNIGELMFLTTLNATTRMLWGTSLRGKDRDIGDVQIRHVVREIIDLIGAPNISDLFPVLARFDVQGVESKAKKHMLLFDKLFESSIGSRMKDELASGEEKKDGKVSKNFLQFLLKQSSLSRNQIKALFVVNIYLFLCFVDYTNTINADFFLMNLNCKQDVISGSTDTSSTTVEWAMAELLQHPEITRKACKELEQVVGNDNIVEEVHTAKLHYLNAILKETLRLHPPLPLLLQHSPSTTCNVSGYTIPKGSIVYVNVWTIHRNPEAWKNPLEFQPDRFLKDGELGDFRGNDFNYLPFGSGRRVCVGIPLAEKMVLHVLANLLHHFKWNLPEGMKLDLSEKFGIVLKKSEPLMAIPTAILSIS